MRQSTADYALAGTKVPQSVKPNEGTVLPGRERFLK